MKKISPSPSPPYICAVFTSIRTNINEGYEEMNNLLFNEIKNIDGYIGNEAFRDKDGFGVNISYWKDLVSLKKWKNNQLHKEAHKLGKTKWYKEYKLRICKVEREYDFKIN